MTTTIAYPTSIDTMERQRHHKRRQHFEGRVRAASNEQELIDLITGEIKRLYRLGEHGHVLEVRGIDPHSVAADEIGAGGRGGYTFADLWVASFACTLTESIKTELGETIETLDIRAMGRPTLLTSGQPAWLLVTVCFA